MTRAKLSPKEEAFAVAIVAGKGPSEAYRAAGYWNGSPKVVSVKAAEIGRKPRVADRIQQLRDRAARPAVLTRQRKLEKLAAMVEAAPVGLPKEHLTPEQLRAVEIDNRMQGHNEPEKLKITGLGTVLQKIRKDARKP